MAIDNAVKRASALSFGRSRLALVLPDGTIDQGDRQTIANRYSGIQAEIPSVSTPDCVFSANSLIDASVVVGASPIDAAATALEGQLTDVFILSSAIDAIENLSGVIDSSVTVLTGAIDDSPLLLESRFCT